MSLTSDARRLPIFPLSDEVHFPCTELKLQITEPDYCALARRLFELGEGRIGTVLLKPGLVRASPRSSPVFPAGTAAALVGFELQESGCEVVLRGEYRFEMEHELTGGPCREALVRPMSEPDLSELDPDVVELRHQLIDRVGRLAGELGDRFDLDDDQMRLFAGDLPFEAMVNHLAANMDVQPTRKLQLLRHALPDRALHLLTILRSRQQVLDVLRPYRHLADQAEIN